MKYLIRYREPPRNLHLFTNAVFTKLQKQNKVTLLQLPPKWHFFLAPLLPPFCTTGLPGIKHRKWDRKLTEVVDLVLFPLYQPRVHSTAVPNKHIKIEYAQEDFTKEVMFELNFRGQSGTLQKRWQKESHVQKYWGMKEHGNKQILNICWGCHALEL